MKKETKRTIEMMEEVLNFIKSVVSMVDEIMKTTEIIEEYDEDEYLENPELLVKMISEVLRNNELVKEIYLKYNPEKTEFFEKFENTLDI